MSEHIVRIAHAHDFRDVRVEKKFTYLNEAGFVRGVTPMDQCHILINETWTKLKLPMNEPVRDYLTCMLARFMTRTNLLEQLSAFEYVPFLIGEKNIDDACVQDIADMSLQYVALFPEASDYRHQMRSVDCVAIMGETLYRVLSRKSYGKEDWFSNTYHAMAKNFGLAVMVLRAMRPYASFPRRKDAHLEFMSNAKVSKMLKQATLFCQMYLESPTALPHTKN